MKKEIIFLLLTSFIVSGCNTIIERDITIDNYYTLEVIDEPTMHEPYDNYSEKYKAKEQNAILHLTMYDLKTTECFIEGNAYVDPTRYDYNRSSDYFVKLSFSTNKSLVNENIQNTNCLIKAERIHIIETYHGSTEDLYAFIEKESTPDGRFHYEAYFSLFFLKEFYMLPTPKEDWTLSINYAPTFLWEFGKTFYLYSSNDVTISASDIEAVLALIPENNTTDTNTTENNDTNSSGG